MNCILVAAVARRGLLALGLAGALGLPACVSVEVGQKAPAQRYFRLNDDHAAAASASASTSGHPRVAALLIQPLPADAAADTTALAYSRHANELAYYQFANWTERPVRQLPRLLQRRLEASGLVGAAGLLGEPLSADWLLTIVVDALQHEVTTPPGQARFALTAELFDRRSRTRIARRQFEAVVPTERADSAAAAEALSLGVTQVFDALLPWLDEALQRGVAATTAPAVPSSVPSVATVPAAPAAASAASS
ncbi:MAG: hypothetical protein RLY71_2440 [Pseudomonadota bacterium]|jgi:ABC-type uncharacterized transport system auxiliary subunit